MILMVSHHRHGEGKMEISMYVGSIMSLTDAKAPLLDPKKMKCVFHLYYMKEKDKDFSILKLPISNT